MSSLLRTATIIIFCTLLAAAAGGWVGVRYGLRQASQEQQLDQVLHHQLHLSSSQEQKISSLETAFAAHREALAAKMRAANQELAHAITVRHRYDLDARQALDRFHGAMMELQEATIEHVLAMRAVLTPEQAQQFDRTINDALTANPL